MEERKKKSAPAARTQSWLRNTTGRSLKCTRGIRYLSIPYRKNILALHTPGDVTQSGRNKDLFVVVIVLVVFIVAPIEARTLAADSR